MSELIELVFDSVAQADVPTIVKRLFAGTRGEAINGNAESSLLERIAVLDSGNCIVEKYDRLQLGKCRLRNVVLRVPRYDTGIDVEISFLSSEINCRDSDDWVFELQVAALDVSRGLAVGEIFCGIEPASDVESRLFTGMTLGPSAIRIN